MASFTRFTFFAACRSWYGAVAVSNNHRCQWTLSHMSTFLLPRHGTVASNDYGCLCALSHVSTDAVHGLAPCSFQMGAVLTMASVSGAKPASRVRGRSIRVRASVEIHDYLKRRSHAVDGEKTIRVYDNNGRGLR